MELLARVLRRQRGVGCGGGGGHFPAVKVNMHSAGLDGRLQVLQERLHCQDVGALLPRRLDHQLRVEHGLLADLLPRVLEFLVDAATDWTGGRKTKRAELLRPAAVLSPELTRIPCLAGRGSFSYNLTLFAVSCVCARVRVCVN